MIVRERKKVLEGMQLHGQFNRNTNNVKNDESLYEWPKRRDLKREIESLFIDLLICFIKPLNTKAFKKDISPTASTNNLKSQT